MQNSLAIDEDYIRLCFEFAVGFDHRGQFSVCEESGYIGDGRGNASGLFFDDFHCFGVADDDCGDDVVFYVGLVDAGDRFDFTE